VPNDPKEERCEICGEQATKVHEFQRKVKSAGLTGRGMFIYSCPKHEYMCREACLPASMRGKGL
jgi:hypothetical protein